MNPATEEGVRFQALGESAAIAVGFASEPCATESLLAVAKLSPESQSASQRTCDSMQPQTADSVGLESCRAAGKAPQANIRDNSRPRRHAQESQRYSGRGIGHTTATRRQTKAHQGIGRIVPPCPDGGRTAAQTTDDVDSPDGSQQGLGQPTAGHGHSPAVS